MGNRRKFINPRYFLNETVDESSAVGQGKPLSTDAIIAAQEKIEVILNDLYDNGVGNDGLTALLQEIMTDIERGFVGEPT